MTIALVVEGDKGGDVCGRVERVIKGRGCKYLKKEGVWGCPPDSCKNVKREMNEKGKKA